MQVRAGETLSTRVTVVWAVGESLGWLEECCFSKTWTPTGRGPVTKRYRGHGTASDLEAASLSLHFSVQELTRPAPPRPDQHISDREGNTHSSPDRTTSSHLKCPHQEMGQAVPSLRGWEKCSEEVQGEERQIRSNHGSPATWMSAYQDGGAAATSPCA